MRFNLLRTLDAPNNKKELLLEVDEELLNVYRRETGEKDFNQKTFDEWVSKLAEQITDDE